MFQAKRATDLTEAPIRHLPLPFEPRAIRFEPEQEKQMTVLFCDIVDSTDYVSRHCLLDQKEFFLSYYEAITSIIVGSGGTVIRYIGDGIQAVFDKPGDPSLAAETAIRASTEILQVISHGGIAPFRRLQRPPRVRISIASGHALIEGTINTGQVRQNLVFGMAPYLAARLNNLCEPDSIVVCDTTRQLVEGCIRLCYLGPHKFKGFEDLEHCWGVPGEAYGE